MFNIDSEESKTVTLNIRCKCLFEYDCNTCVLVTEYSSLPIEIQKIGQWTSVPLSLILNQGENILKIKAVKPMKSDVLIDYIEYQ
ncbi:MAG: hypothetical protein LKI42_04950 [Bacteroidales bacterium]|nr:hypothetical protein [Bacteroidales bacterium]